MDSIVRWRAVEGSGKSIPVLHLKKWNLVESVVRWIRVKDGRKGIPILYLKR